MAIMHPSTIIESQYVHSEVKFFHACKEQLPDKYHVFHSVRWYTTNANGEREDSECDFLIFNPDYGFICVEVKGGRKIEVVGDTWYLHDANGGRELKKSPYLQAEQSMRFFKDYYETELETYYPGVYGYAVAFPNFMLSENITVSSPKENTIDMSDMNNLSKRITEVFRYFRTKKSSASSFFSPDSQKKFINVINKRVALAISAGALIEDKNRELIEINRIQDTVIDLLAHYPRAFLVGGAGTGKTWIAMKKALRCAQGGGDALYLCYNRTLANFVSSSLNNSHVDCYTFDSLAYTWYGEKASYAKTINGTKIYSELFDKLGVHKTYDLVVVDEGQDFTEDWAYCVNLLLKNSGSLYVMYDESQNIFGRNFGEKFFIEEPPFLLRYNIRNTANIYKYVQEKTGLGLDTITNQIEGVEPDSREFKKKSHAITHLDSIINRLVNKEGVSCNKIVLLSDRKKENSILSDITTLGGVPLADEMGQNGIVYKTVQSFKGLESDVVIFLHHTYKNEPHTERKRSMLYTAWTRARFYLYAIDYIDQNQIQ